MDYKLILGILAVSGCSYAPYTKPTIAFEKELARGGKPSVKAKVEMGVVLNPK